MECWRRLLFSSPNRGAPNQKTLSGNPLEFTASSTTVNSCQISFAPMQEGSGYPLPSNIRPITGFSSLAIAAADRTYNFNLNSTCYGGTFDVFSGKVTETWTSFVIDGNTEIDGYYNKSLGVVRIAVPRPLVAYTDASADPEIISDQLRTISQNAKWDTRYFNNFVTAGTDYYGTSDKIYVGKYAWINKEPDEIRRLAAANPITIVYKTSYPATRNIIGADISLAYGTCRMESTPGTSITASVSINEQNAYDGIPVLIDNAKFRNTDSNGTIDDIVEDSRYIIAGWFDTGTTGKKTYSWLIEGEGYVRVFDDKSGVSTAYFSSHEGIARWTQTIATTGRYVAFCMRRDKANTAYMKNGDLYLFKGKDVS